MEAPQKNPPPSKDPPREFYAQRSGSLRHPPLETLIESEEAEDSNTSQRLSSYSSQADDRQAHSFEITSHEHPATSRISLTGKNQLYDHLRRFSFESVENQPPDGHSLGISANTEDHLDLIQPSPRTFPEELNKTELSHGDTSASHADAQYDAIISNPRDSVSGSEYEYHDTVDNLQQSSNMPTTSNKAPDLTVKVDSTRSALPKRADSLRGKNSLKRTQTTPQSPSAKVSNFFGWSSKANAMDSPATIFDESRSSSPGNSPRSPDGQERVPSGSPGSAYDGYDDYFSEEPNSARSASPRPSFGNNGTVTRVDELLRELREVSTELAMSIKREMDLEDEVDRTRSEMPSGPGEQNRRTSDYYSDSGASSSRFPVPDAEFKIQSLEQMRRKAEQSKAQMRIDMAKQVQENLNSTKTLELHIQSLEEELKTREFHSSGTSDKQKELESSIEKLKLRLNEETQNKQTFEVLYEGMKEEIQARCNERDNLRDEVVPQLRARLEGLESQASETQNIIYENTRMAQEIQSLKNENQTLVNARRLQLELQNHGGRFNSISEEGQDPSNPRTGSLSRTNSIARTKSVRNRSSSIYGPGSPKESISVEALPERIKDVEDQRDALHRTLRSLIVRQEIMTKKHTKQLRILETERDKALNGTPRRAAFQSEVQNLRGEINTLRQRADEAMEQKWQCEKGLGGLKMDLDRAQQETSSLRDLLREHDITVPLHRTNTSSSDRSDSPYDESLDQAYESLKGMHAGALKRVEATGERPASLDEAEARLHTLANQVRIQLESNEELRHRLTMAVDRGEREQEASTTKINQLQSALREAEERVMAAQSLSEDTINKQEEHVRQVKETVGEQSLRGLKSPTMINATPNRKDTLSKSRTSAASIPEIRLSLFNSATAKTPRLDRTTSGKGMSVQEVSRTEVLEGRVAELEAAAVQADHEMQGVVERMNKAQIEVAELQTQRDDAMRQTRHLQREILEERERVKAWGR